MVHNHPARFKVLAAGRRWGKTRLGVHECLDVASSGGRAWWVAPNYKMGEVGWRPLRIMAGKVGALVRKVDRQITMPNGGEVTVRSADNPDSLRGEGLDFVVMDECAFTSEATWIEALRPALSDRKGSAMFISTPKGRNWFWRNYQRGLVDGDEWMSWQLPTSDNPYIDPDEIEAARGSLPEVIFEQEYLAIFLESEGAVFRNIAACMNAPDTTPEQHAGHKIVMGVDWGKQADFTALSVGCKDCGYELDIDRFNRIDYTIQQSRLKSMAKKWGVKTILAESNAMGEPIIDQLFADGLPIIGFKTTSASKPTLIENLALTLEREEYQFINDDIWKAELEAYERKVSPVTGRSQYSAPAGMNDDTCIARALMIWQLSRVGSSLPTNQPTQTSKWIDPEQEPAGKWRKY